MDTAFARMVSTEGGDSNWGARARIVQAMVSVVYEEGYAGASVTSLCARAKLSRRTFYETFDSREDCFLAVIDDGYDRTSAVISQAFERVERWQDGVLTALASLLSLFDSEPELARVWLVESLAAGSWALRRRERNVAALTRLIVERWPAPPGAEPHPLATVSVMASVLGAIQSHLVNERPEPLIALLGPLMGIVTAPFVDARVLAVEIERGASLAQGILARDAPLPRPSAPATAEIPGVLRDPRARRARRCLLYLDGHPGASNREVGSAVGVASRTQISTLLARLARMGLVLKDPGRPGHTNAWSLTVEGLRVACLLNGRRLDTYTNHISKRNTAVK